MYVKMILKLRRVGIHFFPPQLLTCTFKGLMEAIIVDLSLRILIFIDVLKTGIRNSKIAF